MIKFQKSVEGFQNCLIVNPLNKEAASELKLAEEGLKAMKTKVKNNDAHLDKFQSIAKEEKARSQSDKNAKILIQQRWMLCLISIYSMVHDFAHS